MSNFQDRFMRENAPANARAHEIDEGLRAYMLRIYNYMSIGLLVTGATAFALANTGLRDLFFVVVGQSPSGALVYGTNMFGMIAMFGPLAFLLFGRGRLARASVATTQVVFLGFAAVFGISVASILLNFTGESVARVFFITAGMFGAISLWGYTTKRDISGWGGFFMMGLIGIIIAMVVNIFLASAAIHFAISVLGVLIFAGLTAYDTQRLKNEYIHSVSQDGVARAAVWGALTLYLDFLNMFMFLMQLLGNRE